MNTSRRAFLTGLVAAALRPALGQTGQDLADQRAELGFPRPGLRDRGDSSVLADLRRGTAVDLGRDRRRGRQAAFDGARIGARLRGAFPNLRRHFVFEYYPWYSTNPYQHWDEAERRPPADVASNYMPLLGAYDSRSRTVVERHARWIAEASIGAIDLSWWGRGSFEDRAVPLVMDVMRAHDIHVTFHLEPYADDRAGRYASDVLYLLREYGDRRRWDCILLLERADGSVGPVFKSFRTIVPSKAVDCHGVTHVVPDYTTDAFWHRQTDLLRETVRTDFDHVTLLADSLDFTRTRAGGFDGIAIYDNFVRPESWSRHALSCRQYDLLFSFNINPGFDAIARRRVAPGSCYRPPAYEPGGETFDWSSATEREEARLASEARIDESLETTVLLQSTRTFPNSDQGFFLTYVNSFNEWHEGHQFEPMRNSADLTPAERHFGYHNPADGEYRLQHLRARLSPLFEEPA